MPRQKRVLMLSDYVLSLKPSNNNNVSFSVAEALMGLIYYRHSGKNSSFHSFNRLFLQTTFNNIVRIETWLVRSAEFQ